MSTATAVARRMTSRGLSTPTGGASRSSTRSTRAASPTPTATGIGDIGGVTARIPYLRSLGVDAVWLSPFYPSALADGGYDVDDYRDVDPRLGTLDDFDEMTAALHGAGMKVIVDIVPNHTSDRHAWFREALAAPKGSPARDRYIFRDGLGADGSEPPSDWESLFGGSAWTRTPDGQWYLHLFAPEQPDLNWDNREVRDDFLTHPAVLGGPRSGRLPRRRGTRAVQEPRRAAAPPRPTFRDSSLPTAPTRCGTGTRCTRSTPSGGRSSTSTTRPAPQSPRRGCTRLAVAALREPGGAGAGVQLRPARGRLRRRPVPARSSRHTWPTPRRPGTSSTWVLSNHDVIRHADPLRTPLRAPSTNRRGPGCGATAANRRSTATSGSQRARAATLLMLALPGLGLPLPGRGARAARSRRPGPRRAAGPGVPAVRRRREGPRRLPRSAAVDHRGAVLRVQRRRRSPPATGWFGAYAVQEQEADAESSLEFYRRALALRRHLQAAEELEWLDTEADLCDVLHFARPGGWQSITNFGAGPVPLPPGEPW